MKIVQTFVRQRILEQPEIMEEIREEVKKEQKQIGYYVPQTPIHPNLSKMATGTTKAQPNEILMNTSSQCGNTERTFSNIVPRNYLPVSVEEYNLMAAEAIFRSVFSIPASGFISFPKEEHYAETANSHLSNLEEGNDEIENADEVDKFIKNIEEKKSFTDIDEGGWCTPWAEVLDTVNIFFFDMEEDEFLEEVRRMAGKLGAGITDDIRMATHIVTEYSTDVRAIKHMVNGV